MKKLLIVTVLTALITLSCGKLGGLIPQKVEKNGVRIEYTGVSKEDANLLLAYLAENNEDGHIEDYKLSKEGDGFKMKMVVKFGFGSTSKDVEEMTEFACEISKKVYGGKMISLDICDDQWKVKNTVKSEGCDEYEMVAKEMRLFGELEMYYGESITTKQQDEVGEYLVDFFGDDERKTFVIDKVNGTGVLSIIVTQKKYYDDAEVLDAYRIIACDLGKILGYTSEIHMCDEYMKKQKVVPAAKCD